MNLSAQQSIEIRHLTTLDHFARCVELQIEVWGYNDGDVVPKRVFTIAQRIGGQVLGAFQGASMVGFAMSLPGYRSGKPYLHSHMLAVVPEYRNAGIGRRLKLAQREDALSSGIDLMEWTFDPLEIKNAHLNIARLGAIARRYQPDFYGPSTSPLQGGLPTDRLYAEWWLRSPRVVHVLRGEAKPLAGGRIVERIAVPHAVSQWKQDIQGRSLARDLQTANREALQSAFGRGLAVIGYERDAEGNGCFLVGHPEEPSIDNMIQNLEVQTGSAEQSYSVDVPST